MKSKHNNMIYNGTTNEKGQIIGKAPGAFNELDIVISKVEEPKERHPEFDIMCKGTRIGGLYINDVTNPNSNYYGYKRLVGKFKDPSDPDKKEYTLNILPTLKLVKESTDRKAKAKREPKLDKEGNPALSKDGQQLTQAVTVKDENGKSVREIGKYFYFIEPVDTQTVDVPDIEVEAPF